MKKSRRWLVFAIGLAVVQFAGSSPTVEASVDASTFGHSDTSLALTPSGSPRLSYLDTDNNDLKYAECDAGCNNPANWSKLFVDTPGSVGWRSSIAVNSSGFPRIAYADNTNDALKYAECNTGCSTASNWTTITIATGGSPFGISMKLNSSGFPRVTFNIGALKYAECNTGCTTPSNWTVVSLGDPSSSGSIALNSAGSPAISYRYDPAWPGSPSLKYAQCTASCTTASNWSTTVISSDNPADTSMDLNSSGFPRISYHKYDGYDDLKYAECNSSCTTASNWTTTSVDWTGNVGYDTSIKVSGSGAKISYLDLGSADLKYAECSFSCTSSSNWTKATLYSSGSTGYYSSLALSGSSPRVGFVDSTGRSVEYAACNSSCTTASNWVRTAPPPVDLRVATGGGLSTDGPATVNAGQSFTLSWSSVGAVTCAGTMQSGTSSFWTGAKGISGSTNGSESVPGLHIYRLDCATTTGTTATDSVTVNVLAVPTVDLKVNGQDGPVGVVAGDAFDMAWTTSNTPASCIASMSSGTSSFWSGSKEPGGGTVVGSEPSSGSPTYSITCTNPVGSATDNVTVNVSPSDPPADDSDPTSGNPQDVVDLLLENIPAKGELIQGVIQEVTPVSPPPDPAAPSLIPADESLNLPVQPGPGLADLRGVVIDQESGLPVANATVSITFPYEIAVTTDASGRFQISGIAVQEPVQKVKIVVQAAGFGTWITIDNRLYEGQGHQLDVFLSDQPVVDVIPPPRSENEEISLDELSETLLNLDGPVYTDQWLMPPRIRVARVQKQPDGCTAASNPPNTLRVENYSLDSYVKHVLPMEISGSWNMNAIRANAIAIKSYAWYWINRGGKWFTPNADVDDSTFYQCFNPNVTVPDSISRAVFETQRYGMHEPDNTVTQASYHGLLPGGHGGYACDNPHADHMSQLGSKAWGDPGCGSQPWDWILNHYYDYGSDMTLFSTPPPAAPYVTSSRSTPGSIGLYFDSRGAWKYWIYKWNGNQWNTVFSTYIYNGGTLSSYFFDNSAQSGSDQWYAVYAGNPGGWSSYRMIRVPSWTTRMWNASFENGTAFWYRVNGGWWTNACGASTTDPTCILRISNSPGTWVSAYQNVPAFGQPNVCPKVDLRRPAGGTANVTLAVWGLGSSPDEVWYATFNIPQGGWYRVYWFNCPRFSSNHLTARFEVYLNNGGDLDMDRAKLTFGSYYD